MTRSEKPKANATPAKPMWLPARTAAPQPPKTSTKVPISSAAYLFIPCFSFEGLGHGTIAFPHNCLSPFPFPIPNDCSRSNGRSRYDCSLLAHQVLRVGCGGEI